MDQFATGLVGTRSPYGAVRERPGARPGRRRLQLRLRGGRGSRRRRPGARHRHRGLRPRPRRLQRHRRAEADPRPGVHRRRRARLREPGLRDASSPAPSPEARAATGAAGQPRCAPPRAPGTLAGGGRARATRSASWTPAGRRRSRRRPRRLARGRGASCAPLDLTPFTEAAALLYDGAFVAERYTAVGAFVDTRPARTSIRPWPASSARPATSRRTGCSPTGERLAALRDRAAAELGDADALLLPTTPGHPTLAEVAADPVGANTRLGRFTNSANLLDLCAVAVPAGEVRGLPFGVMLLGPAHGDERVAGDRRAAGAAAAARGRRRAPDRAAAEPPTARPRRPVGGDHHAPRRSTACTPWTPTPPKPGLVRVGGGRRRGRGRGVGAAARRAGRPRRPRSPAR